MKQLKPGETHVVEIAKSTKFQGLALSRGKYAITYCCSESHHNFTHEDMEEAEALIRAAGSVT